jgi:hypothetical protein
LAVTININGLSLVHKGSGGFSAATLPDVCKTPTPSGPVPIPYPNFGFSSDLAKGTRTVTADGGNSCAIAGSEFAISYGDEPGVVGGVASGTFKKEITWITYSFDVKIENKGACRLTDKMFHNHSNTVNAAGALNPPVSEADIIDALCEVFCRVRKEGEDFKRKNPGKRFDYSKRAKELAKKHPTLKGLSFERKLLVAVENAKRKLIDVAKRAGRRVWGPDAIKKRLVRELAEKIGKKAAIKAAKKAVLKFIPVVNVLSLAWDVYDAVSLGVEAYNLVSEWMVAYDASKYTTFEVIPDVARVGPDGQVTDIWDFKFDRPEMIADDGTLLPEYQDGFTQDQFELYKEKLGGKKPTAIDHDTCKHKCR